MSIEKMREEFEAWQLDKYCGGDERLKRCSNDESVYYFSEVQLKWVAWQASRESLVIDLSGCEEDLHDGGAYYSQCRVDEAIEAVGLKVKP